MAAPAVRVRWSCYSAEFKDPLIDKEHYRKPVEKLTEEKYDRELKKTQLIKAAPAAKTSSVFEDPVVSKIHQHDDERRKQNTEVPCPSAEEQATIEQNPYTIFHQALKNCEPMIGLVPILRGSRFYQVPVPLPDRRRCFLAMKWMITECWENKHRRTLMPEKLSHELLEAFHNQDPAIKRKHDVHKMAEAKRALAHYRWW
uniref:Small ribosomal subunit protein uS7 domain-containing protein n=1 Tax=Cebus imitator TaxID=2715852 RepID=A0A2K5PKR9_CEBIM